MRVSYDAQHNEFCAYVLDESETPFGLTLGNFKAYATCTPKGGVRGLWDADTDQIIFGAHQIAYRLDRLRPDDVPAPDPRARSRSCPTRRSRSSRSTKGCSSPRSFYVPHGARHDRDVAFAVDLTLHNPGRKQRTVTVFPWALLVGQRFYGEPENEVRATRLGTARARSPTIRRAPRAGGAARASRRR